jgi:hypothetical protein
MIWAKKQSVAEFRVDTQAKRVRVAGVLPNDPVSSFNMLDVRCGSNYVASIENPSSRFLDFERTLQLPNPVGPNVVLEFNTHQVFRPARHSDSADCRDLGFALRYLELL